MTSENIQKLIREIKKYPKFNGTYKDELTVSQFSELSRYPKSTVLIKDVFPLANDAYPNKFNLSVSEYLWSEMCKKKGFLINNKFFDYTALPKHSFWTITKNSRDKDLDRILSGSNQHLILFHIVGIGGFTITSLTEESRKFYLRNFLEFLNQRTENLSKLKIAYFDGGRINKHGINKNFNADINKEIYEELRKNYGFSMLPTKNETFLSLKVFGSPIFWGYRNEFFLKHKGKWLDLGTIECLPFVPKFHVKNNEIIYESVNRGELGFIGSGIGLERLIMVLEDVENIWDISLIKPLIELLRKNAGNKKVNDRVLFVINEMLKIFHYLISERGGLTAGELGNKHRREIISEFMRSLIAGIVHAELEVDSKLIIEFISLNKKLNQNDGRDLSVSNNVVEHISPIIKEQLRLYNTSSKYRERINIIINLIK